MARFMSVRWYGLIVFTHFILLGVFSVSCGQEYGARQFDMIEHFSYGQQFALLDDRVDLLHHSWRALHKGTFIEFIGLVPSDGYFNLILNASLTCFETGSGYFVIDGSYLECQYCFNRISFLNLKIYCAESGNAIQECRPINLGGVSQSMLHVKIRAKSVLTKQPSKLCYP